MRSLHVAAIVLLLVAVQPIFANAQVGSGSQPAAGSGAGVLDAVVASVDGTPITLYELDRFGRNQGRLLSPSEQGSDQKLLEAMIRSLMFQAEFKDKGIVGLDSDVEIYIDNVLAQSGSTREQLREALSEIGLTWEVYFERMREEVQRLALINREIRARVSVTPEEVERSWQDDSEFDLPSRVVISDIFIPLPREAHGPGAEMAWRRAQEARETAESKGFADAAREYSKGPTASDGGRLGEFAEGTMAEEFDKQIAQLEEGEISEPFEVGGAIHIIRLDRKLEGGRVPLEQVEQQIREKLYVENLDKRFKRWVEEDLSNRHHVTNNLDAVSGRATPSLQ